MASNICQAHPMTLRYLPGPPRGLSARGTAPSLVRIGAGRGSFDRPWFAPGRACHMTSPRHRLPMPFHSRNEGSDCASVTWPASAWHILPAECLAYIARHVIVCRMNQETRLLNALDDVAGEICSSLAPGATLAHAFGGASGHSLGTRNHPSLRPTAAALSSYDGGGDGGGSGGSGGSGAAKGHINPSSSALLLRAAAVYAAKKAATNQRRSLATAAGGSSSSSSDSSDDVGPCASSLCCCWWVVLPGGVVVVNP